jgi:hypothetical protein
LFNASCDGNLHKDPTSSTSEASENDVSEGAAVDTVEDALVPKDNGCGLAELEMTTWAAALALAVSTTPGAHHLRELDVKPHKGG